jgi:hypothetical protein
MEEELGKVSEKSGGVQMSELKPYIGPHPTDHTLTEYYLKSEADKVIAEKDKEARHQKYKRCLAMARWCAAECDIFSLTPKPARVEFYRKWRKRWLELAENY